MKENTDYYKQFVTLILQLGRRYELSRVFCDFLTISMCGFHPKLFETQAQENDPDVEALYMRTIDIYEKDEVRNIFPKMLGFLMLNAQQKPYSDLLGQFFTEHITMGHNGQFFTPNPVCNLMAQLVGAGQGSVENKTICDPACGSGRMLLETAQNHPNNYFFANDVHETCARMTALNFFLNGLKGEVAWMNTLSLEWYGAWRVHYPRFGIEPVSQEQSILYTDGLSKIDTPPPELPSDYQGISSKPGQQLSLF